MTLDPESARKLREMFAAITIEVERAHGGHVEAWIFCGPRGKILDWHVDPARVKAKKGVDEGVGSGSQSG